MPSDDYASISRGPLKLKGAAGVAKKKKKKSKDKGRTADLEKNLSTGDKNNNNSETALVPAEAGDDGAPERRHSPGIGGDDDDARRRRGRSESGEQDRDKDKDSREEDDNKTETERRFAEAKRKRVRLSSISFFKCALSSLALFSPIFCFRFVGGGGIANENYCQKTVKRADRVRPHPARAAQDAQAASRRAERAPGAAERASRHAQDWTRLRRQRRGSVKAYWGCRWDERIEEDDVFRYVWGRRSGQKVGHIPVCRRVARRNMPFFSISFFVSFDTRYSILDTPRFMKTRDSPCL